MTHDQEVNPAVGQRLRWVRDLAGLTQQEVAAESSAQGGWSRFENGVRMIPIREALEFCSRFQVSMDYIYRGHLTGVRPALAEQLLALHPELVRPPISTGWIDDR